MPIVATIPKGLTNGHSLHRFIPAVCFARLGLGQGLRSFGGQDMNAEYILALLTVVGLMVYLIAVLVNPEDFT